MLTYKIINNRDSCLSLLLFNISCIGILFIIPFACPFVCFQLRALILTVTDSAPIEKHMVDIGYDEETGTIGDFNILLAGKGLGLGRRFGLSVVTGLVK